jgi:hypothetical protein
VQQSKSPRPPSALRIDVGTSAEQDIEHPTTAGTRDDGRVEGRERLVDLPLHPGCRSIRVREVSRVVFRRLSPSR